MTKGHYHEIRERAEVYYGLSGEGRLVVAKDDGHGGDPDAARAPWPTSRRAGRTARSNTGSEPFVFLAVYHGDAGHDYGTIETEGFPLLVLERDGEVAVVSRQRRSEVSRRRAASRRSSDRASSTPAG